MNCLDILGMIISPSTPHPFWLDVVGDDLVVIRKGLLADSAFSVLLNNFPVQQLAHLCGRPEFAISPRVVRIFDALNPKLKSSFFPVLLATAAEDRSVKRAVFIPTEFHGYAPA
jgi:hypothetical protein